MIGGFPDENQVMDLISKGEWAQVKLVNKSSCLFFIIH